MSTNRPTPPAKLAKFKVTPIAPVVADISPPEDWNIRHPQGFYMAADDTPAGRLVLLADVLRWLENSHPLPRKKALSVLCDAMPTEIVQCLYWAQFKDYAEIVNADYWMNQIYKEDFEEKTRYIVDLNRDYSFWENDNRVELKNKIISELDKNKSDGILSGNYCFHCLLKVITKAWSIENHSKSDLAETQDKLIGNKLASLSITLDKAAEIWGYVRTLTLVESAPETYAELVDYRAKNKGANWSSSMIEILRTEVAARHGQPQARKKIAAELEISAARIGQLLDENRNPKVKPAPRLRSA